MTDAPVPGMELIDDMMAEAAARSISLSALAEMLGISRAYLYALRNGKRLARGLDRPVLLAIASFLGRTPASVYVAAGVLQPEDFFRAKPEILRNNIDRAFEFIADDPEWCEFCPAPTGLSAQAKLFVVLAYQRANDRQLLPRDTTREELLAFARSVRN